MMVKVLLPVSLMILDLVPQVMEEQHIHHLLMILIIQLLQVIQLQLFQLRHMRLFLHLEDMEHLHQEVILLQVDLAMDIRVDQQADTEPRAVDMELQEDLVLRLRVVLPHMELQAFQLAMVHQALHQEGTALLALPREGTVLQARSQEDIVLRVHQGMELQVHLEDMDIQVDHLEVMELHHLQQEALLPAIQVPGDHQEDHQLVVTELLLVLVVQLLVLEDMGMPHLHQVQHQVIHPQAQVGIQQPHIQLIHQVHLKLPELLK